MQKTLFEGRFIRLVENDGWEFADRVTGAGAVCIVAVDGEHVLLVEEFRQAVSAPVISLPAGLIDRAEAGKTQETAIEAALRELREETGYRAHSIEQVASGPISAGMTTEQVTFLLARNLKAGQQMLDAGEEIKVHRVPLKQLRAFLGECSARGAAIDPKIFAGLYFVKTRGLMGDPRRWLSGWRDRVEAKRLNAEDAGEGETPTRPAARRANADDALARLGKVLNWAGLTVGFISGAWVLICLATLLGVFGYYDVVGTVLLAVAGIIVGFFGWLAGRTALFILAGR